MTEKFKRNLNTLKWVGLGAVIITLVVYIQEYVIHQPIGNYLLDQLSDNTYKVVVGTIITLFVLIGVYTLLKTFFAFKNQIKEWFSRKK